jgi:hypothetical protein
MADRWNVKPMSLAQCVSVSVRKSRSSFVLIVFTFMLAVCCLRALLGSKVTDGRLYANDGLESDRSLVADILAYNLISLSFAIYCSVIGVNAWFGAAATELSGSSYNRLYAYSPAVQQLCVATTAYEAFNVVATFVLPEYRTVDFIGHHVTTLILGVIGFHPWCHYYMIFFFGVATVSSVPLCLAECFNAFGGVDAFEMAARGLFAVLFVIIRTFYWPYVSYFFWKDMLYALAGRKLGRVHSVAAYVFLLAANIGLTSLQFLWTGLIANAVSEALTPPPPPPPPAKLFGLF